MTPNGRKKLRQAIRRLGSAADRGNVGTGYFNIIANKIARIVDSELTRDKPRVPFGSREQQLESLYRAVSELVEADFDDSGRGPVVEAYDRLTEGA